MNRRQLLASGAALAAICKPSISDAASFFASRSGSLHNGGKAQICIDVRSGTQQVPFLNAMKGASGPMYYASNAGGVGLGAGFTSLDSRGYPTADPTSISAHDCRTQGVYVYGDAGLTWVVDLPNVAPNAVTWSLVDGMGGAGNIALQAGGTSIRREYKITNAPNSPGLITIQISAMTPNAFANGGEIRIYRKDYESLINSGHIFDPGFLSQLQGFGVVRPIDWMSQTQSTNASLWSHMGNPTDTTWLGGRVRPDMWAGDASISGNDYTLSQPSTPVSLTNGATVQFGMQTPAFRTPSSAVSSGSNTVFTDNAHPYNVNDVIEFQANTGIGAWGIPLTALNSLGGPSSWTITATTTNTYTIALNSSTFGAYPGGLICYKQITLTVGALAKKPCSWLRGILNFRNDIWVGAGAWVGNNNPQIAVYNSAYDRWLMPGTADTPLNYLYGGPPPAVMVQLANQIGCHLHYNIPVTSLDDLVSNLAAYCRDNLFNGLQVRPAWGNEVWNLGNYWGSGWAQQMGAVEPAFLNGPLARGGSSQEWFGFYSAHCADLFTAAYAGSGKSFKWLLEMQGADPSSAATNPAMLCPPYSGYVSVGSPGDPTKYPQAHVQSVAYAPYTDPVFWSCPFTARCLTTAVNYPGYAQAIYDHIYGGLPQNGYNFWKGIFLGPSADLTNFPGWRTLNVWVGTITPQWVALANAAGLECCQYEGWLQANQIGLVGQPGAQYYASGFPTTVNGQTITSIDVQNSLFDFLQNSQQCADLATAYLSQHAALGVKFPAIYGAASSHITNGASTKIFSGSVSGTTLTVAGSSGSGINVGDLLHGAGITPTSVSPTVITARGTGTGGDGTYTISRSYSIATPEFMATTAAVLSGGFWGINDTYGYNNGFPPPSTGWIAAQQWSQSP